MTSYAKDTVPDGTWVITALRKPSRSKKAGTETSDVTGPAVKALNGIPGVHCIRINAGGHRGRMMGAPKGTPDILGSVKGRAFVIETKMPGGKPSKEQRLWHASYGHLYLYGIAYSVKDCVELVTGWRSGV